jgi:hypothetical protein
MDASKKLVGRFINLRVYFYSLLILLLLVPGVFDVSDAQKPLTDLLPEAFDGWDISEKDQTYNRDNLFEYINGGAELYLSYGFTEVLSRRYSRPDQPDVVVDVFDMQNSRNAFGVFSFSREIVDQTFGQGSQYTAGLMLFWKDGYYVSILASPETPESKDAVYGLARHLDEVIADEGPLPGVLSLLPRPGLIKESVRYFFHYIWLNSHYFIADENILHIDETTEALLAKYDRDGRRLILLLIQYRGEKEASRAYGDFAKSYLPELSKKPAVQIEDGTWTGCRKENNLLMVVFNAGAEDEALDLMGAVQTK